MRWGGSAPAAAVSLLFDEFMFKQTTYYGRAAVIGQ